MSTNNIITLETNIRIFCIRVDDLISKMKKKEIENNPKRNSILLLHRTAEELQKQVNECLCREKYILSFKDAFSKIKNMYFDVLRVEEIRRDI